MLGTCPSPPNLVLLEMLQGKVVWLLDLVLSVSGGNFITEYLNFYLEYEECSKAKVVTDKKAAVSC